MRPLLFIALLFSCTLAMAQVITAPVKEPSGGAVENDTAQKVKKARVNEHPDKKSAFFQINGGLAVPLGDYGSHSIFNRDAQFALGGYDLGIEGGVTIYRWIGFSAAAGIAANRIEVEELYTLGNLFYGISITDFEAKGFKHIYGSAGLLVSIPVKEYFIMDFKLHAGVSNGIDGEISYTGMDTSGTTFREEAAKVNDIAIMPNLGFTVRKNISSMFHVAVNVNYKGAHYEFVDRKAYVNGALVGQYAPYEVQMHLLTVGLGLGVSF